MFESSQPQYKSQQSLSPPSSSSSSNPNKSRVDPDSPSLTSLTSSSSTSNFINLLVKVTLLVAIDLLLLSVVDSAPASQYDSFIRTNQSKSVPVPQRNEPHKERHNHETQVQTTTGTLRGLKRTSLGKEVFVYLGVPFAEPPLGKLRFRKPEPVKSWHGVYNAVNAPNSCFQERYESFPGFKGEEQWNPNTNLSEDCLYMNIWAPKNAVKNAVAGHNNDAPGEKSGLPVLVWIYGGGYMAGTATLDVYNADILAAENEAIIIGINYRVGSFGFLFFGIDDAPGNQALMDQVVALKWIKNNIRKFGGNPNLITLFGESAGGGSVSFHMLSPLTRDLFRRGILQSGTLNAPWSIMEPTTARQIALDLARDCNCNDTSYSESQMVDCLREVPAQQISTLQWNSYKNILGFPSAPTIDGVFLPRHPMQMLKDKDFKETEVLLGSNKNEGTYFVLYDFLDLYKKEGPNCFPREKYVEIINQVFPDRSKLEKEAILFQYTNYDDSSNTCRNADLFNDLVGDYWFICPTNIFAETYADHGNKVYYYFFTQRTSSNPWGEWMGVMHGDEVEYVFGLPLNNSHEHTNAEKDLSRRIMRYFVRFAETGNPSDPNDEWPLYTRENPRYYILNANERGHGRGPRSQHCTFWNEFMPLIGSGTSTLPSRCERGWDPIAGGGTSRANILGDNGSGRINLLLLQVGATIFLFNYSKYSFVYFKY